MTGVWLDSLTAELEAFEQERASFLRKGAPVQQLP